MRVNDEERGDRSTSQADGESNKRSRTDRGNQNDEGIGSSATPEGGGGETNATRRANAADVEPTPEQPDVIGTKDALE
jgi:hypothetical protein